MNELIAYIFGGLGLLATASVAVWASLRGARKSGEQSERGKQAQHEVDQNAKAGKVKADIRGKSDDGVGKQLRDKWTRD